MNEDLKCRDCEEDERKAKQKTITRSCSSQQNGCKHCRRKVTNKDQAILCDRCNEWMHATCEKVGEDILKQVEEEILKIWFCGDCSTQYKISK